MYLKLWRRFIAHLIAVLVAVGAAFVVAALVTGRWPWTDLGFLLVPNSVLIAGLLAFDFMQLRKQEAAKAVDDGKTP